jgi:hypothetical protein
MEMKKFIPTTLREFLNENIYNEIPQPFKGIDVIGMATFGNKEYPTDAYEAYAEQYDLPNEPILYIHSFFPKQEYTGKGLTKKYLLKTLSDWANHRLYNKELIERIGKRALKGFGGSDFFGTSSFYDAGEKFFNNLVEGGFLEKINLKKKKEGRALNLFKITDKTKNINI